MILEGRFWHPQRGLTEGCIEVGDVGNIVHVAKTMAGPKERVQGMLLLCFVPSPLMTIPSPFGLEMEAAEGELEFAAGGSNSTLIWVNNTGEVHDNLTLALKLPANWRAPLAVTNVTSGTEWLNPGNATFSDVVWQPDPFNLTLNLTAGASAQLLLELVAPTSLSELAQALLTAESRSEATYTLRMSLLPEAAE